MTVEVIEQIATEVKNVASTVEKSIGEVKSQVELTTAEFKKVSDDQKKQQEQLDNLTSHIQKLGVKGEAKERAELDIKYNAAFSEYLRTGVKGSKSHYDLEAMQSEYIGAMIDYAQKTGDDKLLAEVKSFSTNDFRAGGVLVPVQVANQIVAKQRDFSDVRRYANVQTSDIGGLVFPYESDDFGFGWTGEGESRTADDAGKFDAVEIPLNEARATVPVTNKMRMNRAFDISSYISTRAANRLSRGEGAAFVVGDGHKKPQGFMTYDAGTGDGQVQQVTTLTTTSISHEDLTNLKTPVREFYRSNARYFMNRFTEGYVEKLEDSAGNPLFNRGDLAAGIARAIKGYPTALLDDMDGADETTGALTANDLVMLFGDLKAFYTILDHTATMSLIVDPYGSNATTGTVKYHFYKYVGGGVTDFRAATILKVKS